MDIGGFITVSVVLGVAMSAEALLLLYIGLVTFRSGDYDNALYTFSFLTLLYLVRVLHCVREGAPVVLGDDAQQNPHGGPRGWTRSWVQGLTLVGLPGLMPLPWWQPLTILLMPWFPACRERRREGRNDQWRVPMAVTEKPLDRTPQITNVPMNYTKQARPPRWSSGSRLDSGRAEIRKDDPIK